MVVRKYRYIAFKYSIETNPNIEIEHILGIIKDKVNENYGENILYRLYNLLVLEHLIAHKILLIRVDRDITKYVIFSLVSSGRVNKLNCKFTFLHISGICKKLLKKVYTSLNNKIED